VVVLPATLAEPVAPLAHRALRGPAAEPIGPPLDCNLGFVPVKANRRMGSIIGNAWAQRTIPPEAHALAPSLERRGARAWARRPNPPDPRIPAPRLVYESKTAMRARNLAGHRHRARERLRQPRRVHRP
jgi:hypothetical protein